METGNSTSKYIHARADPDNDISVNNPSDCWITNIEVPPGEEKEKKFEVEKDNSGRSGSRKLNIDIYHSDSKLFVSDRDKEIPKKSDNWGTLNPELELV